MHPIATIPVPPPDLSNRARGDRVRAAVLTRLERSESLPCADLADDIGIHPVTMARHLRRLESQGLVLRRGGGHTTVWMAAR